MNRRDFLRSGGAVSLSLAFPGARLLAEPDGWRTFEVTTRVEVLKPSGATCVFVPAALTVSTPYQKTLANTFQCDGGVARIIQNDTERRERIRLISARKATKREQTEYYRSQTA